MIAELTPSPPVHETPIVFRNGDAPLPGTIWLPSLIPTGRGYPAIVVIAPGLGADPTGADCARRLAEEGHVALAFDPSRPGRIGGAPGDVGGALDFLSALPFVDVARLGVLGIGAGRGSAVRAAATDRRIRAAGLLTAAGVEEPAPSPMDRLVQPVRVVDRADDDDPEDAGRVEPDVRRLGTFFREHLAG